MTAKWLVLSLRWLETIFRGFGQLFLANRVTSGALFFLGLSIASPSAGLLSLLGAAIFSAIGLALRPEDRPVHAGLFGVNGVLLGYLWVLWPEVPLVTQLVCTAIGSGIGALLFAGCLRQLAKKGWGFTPFSLPYVLIAWGVLGVLTSRGTYDVREYAAWNSLGRGSYATAEAQFQAAKLQPLPVRAYRADGLGWAEFRQANYDSAIRHFTDGVSLDPTFADPHDGLGWSRFRQAKYKAAEDEFRRATELNPGLADSWNGLGWIALANGDADAARTAFTHGAWSAPLSSDAFAGLAQAYAAAGDNSAAARCGWISAALAEHVGLRFQYLPLRLLICWGLLAAGLLWHSRISTLMAAAAIAVCWGLGRLPAPWGDTASDTQFVFNLMAAYLVCGGLQLRLHWLTAVWMVVLTAALFAGWTVCGGTVPGTDVPLLILPLNVALAVTALAAKWLKRWGGVELRVPPELAVTSPENVRLWQRKTAIAERCWEKLATDQPKR